MSAAQLWFLLVVFAIACALVWLGVLLFAPAALRERLGRFMGKSEGSQLERDGWVERVA
jgi:tight adherence protein C